MKHHHLLAASLVLLAMSEPALAHHPTGDVTPQTFLHGLLSGIGHPIIGLDHLAFIVAAGAIAAGFARGYLLPLAFMASGAVGAWLHWNSISVLGAELAIAFSVITLGVVLLIGRKLPATLVAIIFAISGFFHGFALFESIIGAEMGPLGAYLIGLAISQFGVALLSLLATRLLAAHFTDKAPLLLRAAGAAFAVFGAVLTLSAA
jgi:urease accessory protein